MAEDKEVTRAELEGLLWGWIQDKTHGGGEDTRDIARLLHESITARERDAQDNKR